MAEPALPLTPGPEEFARLARAHRVVPVAVEVVADTITPVAAFARLCREGPAFLLESVEHGERWGRWSFLGRRPAATIVSQGGRVEVRPTEDVRPGVSPFRPGTSEIPGAAIDPGAGVLAALEAVLATYESPEIEGLPPLHGGLVGYLGYDVIREVERLPEVPTDDQGLPEAILTLVGELAAFDHWRQRVTLVVNVFVPEEPDEAWIDAAYATAADRLAALAADGATPVAEPLILPPDPADPLPDVRATIAPEDYTRAVEVAKEHILAGDIFQVVLSQRYDLDLGADPFDVYRVLRQVNPSPCMFLVRHDEVTLVGSSPEPLVQLHAGRVVSRPIAGTRYRGRTEEEDRRLAAELAEDPKERSEHVMLVDLARNDVGRVVRYGTCRVEEMMTLERYSHVMHLTSQVAGELAEGNTPIDVLRATLPAGTLTGAPKVRAMEIIDALETTKRGPYGGVVGYVDFSGVIDTAIAIRTMVCRPDGRASVQAGAGIVADSVPENEDLECRNKARALLAAVPAARRMAETRLRS